MTDQKDLKEYTNTKKSSKLLPYKENIQYLLDNNASQVAILKYLEEKENLPVTRPTLSNFIKNHIKKTPFVPKEKKEDTATDKEQSKPQKIKESIFDD